MVRLVVTDASKRLDEVIVGILSRGHGVRGQAVVSLRTDQPELRFAIGSKLRTQAGRELTVTSTKQVGSRFVVGFAEINNRTEADQLAGQQLLALVPADESPDGPEEYYDRQLIGLAVKTTDGKVVGEISQVQHYPAQELLVVHTKHGQQLVPFVADLVPVVELAAGFIQLAEVAGLVDDEED